LEDVNVFFSYSSGDCDSGGSGDWNVPAGTVLKFTVHPKPNPRLADLKLDMTKFKQVPSGHVIDIISYLHIEEGLLLEVDRGRVNGFYYGPAAADESMRCPDYQGISFSSDIPKDLRQPLLERLNLFVEYSQTRQYEKLYELYVPESTAKMFSAKNKQEFAKVMRSSETSGVDWVEFKPLQVWSAQDDAYGKAYDVFGVAKTVEHGRAVESYRKTRAVIRGKEWYLVEIFRLAR
jgi:hypothetical protein